MSRPRIKVGQWWMCSGTGRIVEVVEIREGEVWAMDPDGAERWHLASAFIQTHDGPIDQSPENTPAEPLERAGGDPEC